MESFDSTWRCVRTKGWEVYMPPARPQHIAMLPRPRGRHDNETRTSWGGACCVHAFYETLTARLRIWYEKIVHDSDEAEELWYDPSSFKVDLFSMIHCTAGRGLLTESGASVYSIGCLAAAIGIPLEGEVLPYANLRPKPQQNHPLFAKGITLACYPAVPLPWATPTGEKIKASMLYRKHICACLDEGPIAASIEKIQQHYFSPRPDDEPYRRLPDGIPLTGGHAICLYGYYCPDGTLKSLLLKYQENALLTHPDPVMARNHYPDPNNGPPARHIIDPDAIDWYTVPDVTKVSFSNTPGNVPGIINKPEPKTMWEDVSDGIKNLLS